MDFRKLTDDLNIISALGDNPNADNTLTPSGLKAKFDEAALKIKHFLNEVLIPDLYTAVESEEFRGQPGLSPTVEAERFQDSTGSGVKLVITTPVPPDSGLLDSVISIPLYDGADGVTPKIRNVDIEVLEYGADASAEITGPTNNLNLLLKIPRGEPGRTGDTPFIRTSGIVHTDGRHGTQFAIYDSQSAVNPSQTVTVYDGKDGEKGDPGKTAEVLVTRKRESDGRMAATITVIDPVNGSSQSATVYDGKDGKDYTPKPLFLISGIYNGGYYWMHQYGSGGPATVEEIVDAFFGGGICTIETFGESTTMTKRQGKFVISKAVEFDNLRIYEGTAAQYQAAVSKYLPEE